MSAVRVLRAGSLSVRVPVRPLLVGIVLAVVATVVAVATLGSGDYPLGVDEVLRTLAGQGDAIGDLVVFEFRLPRLATALLVGAALGMSGAILQDVSGNALGTPDIVGFTTGAATGAILVVIAHGGGTAVALGALVGGFATAAAVYLLSARRGVSGPRLILIGIGVSAMLYALNTYLISRAALPDALAAQAWLVGGLDDRGPGHAVAVGVALVVLVPIALALGRRLQLLRLGDRTAAAFGVHCGRTRLALTAVSVGLAAVATAAAGPVLFVAFAAPHLARTLTRGAAAGLLPAALLGAVLLAGSDLAVQRLFDSPLPVGIATAVLGGGYLVWMLARLGVRR